MALVLLIGYAYLRQRAALKQTISGVESFKNDIGLITYNDDDFGRTLEIPTDAANKVQDTLHNSLGRIMDKSSKKIIKAFKK